MRTHMRHVEDEQLLRYVDGELPARAAGKVRGHLEACWQCRAGLEELQSTITGCVRYRKVLQRCLPSPPAPWFDIYRGFAEIDTASEPGFFERLVQAIRLPAVSMKAWAIAGVALLIVTVLVLRFRESPSVQAAELLRKAVAAAETHPAPARTIEIRSRKHRLSRLAGVKDRPLLSAADSETASSLQALFLAARFDWADPLSARSYKVWRDQLPSKQDEVVQEQDSYRIRTSTASGALASATLRLRMQDLQPVEERLEFRNDEWIEITPVRDVATFAPEPAGINRPAPAGKGGSAGFREPGRVALPAGGATAGDELRVIAALHEVGADLGDPIEIARTGDNVLVTGVGIAQERQHDIEAALAAQPRVIVRFSESAPAKGQPEVETRAEATVTSDVRQLQAQITQQIGGRANFDRLAAEALDLSDAMMSRVYALRRLAERFPTQSEAALGPQDLRLLASLRQEHSAVLRQKADEMDRLLRPVLASGSQPAIPADRAPSATWQESTQDLLQSSHEVEKLLAVIFGATPGESADQQLPSRLLSRLARLRFTVDAMDHIGNVRSDR